MGASTHHLPATTATEPPVVATVIEVLRAASVISAALTPVVREFGLTLAAFNVLHTLAHADSPLLPRDISQRQVIRPQTLSDILGTLEEDGLVDRLRDRRDRRMLLVALTDTGRTRYHACCQPLLTVETQLLNRLNPHQLGELFTLLNQISQDTGPTPR